MAEENATDLLTAAAFPRSLLYDLAIKTAPISELLKLYSLSVEQFSALVKTDAFKLAFKEVQQEVEKAGFTFQLKSATMGESSLPVVYELAHDRLTPPAVRLAAVQHMVKWGKLEPAPAQPTDGAGGWKVVINLGPQTEPKVIAGEVAKVLPETINADT